MNTAKIFMNGRSQAVRLPKECRFAGNEVYVRKLKGVVMLVPKEKPWQSLVASLDQFTPDFMDERGQPDQQSREDL